MNPRAYIELARLSNAPTIVSNVLVGIAIALAVDPAADIPWLTTLAMSIAILLLYAAGMALNDAIDVAVDQRERPERPIPSGRVSLQAAYAFASLCMAGGVAIAALHGAASGLLAGGLVIAIVCYSALHKRHAWSAVFLGACRGLVYLAAAAAVVWPLDWTIAGPVTAALTVYVVLVTLTARGEASGGPLSPIVVRFSIVQITVVLSPALWIIPNQWSLVVIAALALIAWLVVSQRFLIGSPLRVKDAVMAMLAGICLIDAFYLALLEQPTLAVIAAVCFVATVMGHRAVAGT